MQTELGFATRMLPNLKYWEALHKISHNNNGLEEQTLHPINLNNQIVKLVNLRVNNLDWAVNFDGRSLIGKEKVSFLNSYSVHTAANVLRVQKGLEKNLISLHLIVLLFYSFYLQFILAPTHFSQSFHRTFLEGADPQYKYEKICHSIEMSSFVLCCCIDLFGKDIQTSVFSFKSSLHISLLYFSYF